VYGLHVIKSDALLQEFDVVQIGEGDSMRRYPVPKGREEWKSSLLQKFPSEAEAIQKFFKLVDDATASRRFLLHFCFSEEKNSGRSKNSRLSFRTYLWFLLQFCFSE
jgi:hypothetical protein